MDDRASRVQSWAGRVRHRIKSQGEEGAVLILALVFIVFISLSILALVSFTGNGLLNTANLQQASGLNYAADGATTEAVQAVRSSYLVFNGGVGANGTLGPLNSPCTPNAVLADEGGSVSTETITINEGSAPPYTLMVYCNSDEYSPPQSANPSFQTRVITFYTCLSTSSITPQDCTSGQGPTSPLLVEAQVTFDDFAPPDTYTCPATPPTVSTCGAKEDVNSWIDEGVNG